MNVKQRIYEHWTTQVLGASTTEERSGRKRRNIAKQDARGTTGHSIDVASRTPGKKGRTVRLFGINSL
jgi:RNA:NAD 2'-phosphotransferase (TPT1/KptA family)